MQIHQNYLKQETFADQPGSSKIRCQGKSVKATSTIVEDNQFFTMEAEVVESEFPESLIESDDDQDLEVSFKNSSQESGRNNNAIPEAGSDTDESNCQDEQNESDDQLGEQEELTADHQMVESENEQSNEEMNKEDMEAMKRVQRLMAKEGFK